MVVLEAWTIILTLLALLMLVYHGICGNLLFAELAICMQIGTNKDGISKGEIEKRRTMYVKLELGLVVSDRDAEIKRNGFRRRRTEHHKCTQHEVNTVRIQS